MLNLYNANSHTMNGINKDPARFPAGSFGKKGYQKYVDPSGDFPAEEFKLSLWYVKNRVLLYKILVGTLFGFSAIFWSFSLWKWGDFLVFGLVETQKLARESAVTYDYTLFHPLVTAQPLQVEGVKMFSGNAGKIDAVAMVTNPNPRFKVSFDYYFVFGDQKTLAQRGFLLAGETRPIVQLGLDDANYSGDGSLVIENIAWRRISGHEVSDPIAWQKERLNFTISDFQYISKGSALAGDSSAVQFKLKNDSAYGYVSPKFLIGLFQNQNLEEVVPFEVDKFSPQEIRDVDVRNFPTNLNVTEVQIFSLIDPYNKEVYLEPEK